MLHLSFLRVNGEAVAYNLGLIAGSRYYYLKTSYRQRHREYRRRHGGKGASDTRADRAAV